jgi:hypothetical protein
MPVARNTWQPSLIVKPASAVRRRGAAPPGSDDRAALTQRLDRRRIYGHQGERYSGRRSEQLFNRAVPGLWG